jgi:hypothetical protein
VSGPQPPETVLLYATNDSAPRNAAVRRPQWLLHGGAAGLLRTVGTLGGDVTSRMAARSASPRQASSDRSLLPKGTLSRAAESRLVSTLRSTATIAHPSVGTTGRHRPSPGLIQPRHSSTFPTFQLDTLRDFR